MVAMARRRQCKRLAVHVCRHQVPGKSKQPGSVERIRGKCQSTLGKRGNNGADRKPQPRRRANLVHMLGGKLLGRVPCRRATAQDHILVTMARMDMRMDRQQKDA